MALATFSLRHKEFKVCAYWKQEKQDRSQEESSNFVSLWANYQKNGFLPISSSMKNGQLLLYDISSEFQGQEGGRKKKTRFYNVTKKLAKLSYSSYKFQQRYKYSFIIYTKMTKLLGKIKLPRMKILDDFGNVSMSNYNGPNCLHQQFSKLGHIELPGKFLKLLKPTRLITSASSGSGQPTTVVLKLPR